MRHRIIGNITTGLGNPAKELLNNTSKIEGAIKEMLNEAIKLYFSKLGGCDFQVEKDCIKFGIEPAYMYEDLKIILLAKVKGNSYLKTGRAFGGYGSGIRSTTKFYSDYTRNGKFKKFIDRWHDKIYKLQ